MTATNPSLSNSLSSLDDCCNVFHDNITREGAEDILKKDGEEGTFLIRKSTSSIGDYILSTFNNNEVLHIHIHRHGNDAFFSIEENNVIHGLDELINYYLSSSLIDSTILLRKPILNSQIPSDCRLHGRTNLLHRATKEGNSNIVLEMVRCGYRSLDARNDKGQTATHLASINGFHDIIVILIEAGTNVNAKDSASCTPLHYACMNNHPKAVQSLLIKGQANPQLRRRDNGWVPMHEAAAKGHIECIKVLLENGAPNLPRTDDKKFPIDLAKEFNNQETYNYLNEYIVEKPKANREDWYHSYLERQDAVDLLFQCQEFHNKDSQKSYFLVRRSAKKPKVFVLTLLWQSQTFHFEICREENHFFIDDGPYLLSLEHFVDHYSLWADGLPAKLQVPVNPLQSFTNVHNNYSNYKTSPMDTLVIPPPLPARSILSTSPNLNRNINDLNSTDILNNNSAFTKENIPSEWLDLGRQIGEGEYGEVYEGTLRIPNTNTVISVAIKTLKEEMCESTRNEFLREARNMMDLNNEHIVKIIGISWEPRIYMIQELLNSGSLQDYLIENKETISPNKHIPRWITQIAKGMVYLQEKRFVHRDLASRNILLLNRDVAKISDFGLSRALGMDSNYYTASNGGKWPIKWYAPESCAYGTFSHASDVWSFAIMLWECYSYGETPYGELQGKDVIELVDKGVRLERPQDCPNDVFQMMEKCWDKDPNQRPTFTTLRDFFYSKISL